MLFPVSLRSGPDDELNSYKLKKIIKDGRKIAGLSRIDNPAVAMFLLFEFRMRIGETVLFLPRHDVDHCGDVGDVGPAVMVHVGPGFG